MINGNEINEEFGAFYIEQVHINKKRGGGGMINHGAYGNKQRRIIFQGLDGNIF